MKDTSDVAMCHDLDATFSGFLMHVTVTELIHTDLKIDRMD